MVNVVHYTLELNQNYVGLRYDTIFSGVPTNLQYSKEDVKKKISKLKGTLLIKYFPTKDLSVKLHLIYNKCEMRGIKPDLDISGLRIS